MKKAIFVIMMCALSANLFSQEEIPDTIENIQALDKKNCLSVGFFNGGGSLLGVDFEFTLVDQVAFQIGAGLIGFGCGLNYHFKPTIRSSFISLMYWNQGIGESFAQNAIGPNYVFRGKKWFTFQIGFGFPLEKGPAMKDDFEQPPVMLMYAIGVYIPL